MAETTNLNIPLVGETTDEKKMLFSEWRRKVNGEDPNSMANLIDAAFGEMKSKQDSTKVAGKSIGADNNYDLQASDVGAVPTGRKVNNKPLSGDVTLTASDVGARSSSWMPTAEQVGARPSTWTPTAADVGARPSTWTPTASDVGALPASRGNEIDDHEERLDAIEGAIKVHRYGVLWNKSNAACTRLYDAVGMVANAHKGSYNAALQNDFDDVYPWSHRKLCNIDIATYRVLHTNGEDFTNAIVAWEGDPDFAYDGSNGMVCVYTPEYWMCTNEVEGGVEFIIADAELPGYIHVPQIIGGRYLASADGDGVTSKAGVIPLVNTAMSAIHTKAKAYDMTLDDIWTYCAESMLMVVEFANMNTQSAIGDGVSSLYRQNEADKPLVAATGATSVVAPVAIANLAIPGAILDIGTSNGGNQVGKRIVTSVETYAANTNYKTVHFSGGAVDITTSQFLSIHGLSNMADEAIGSASGYIGTNGKSNAYYRGRVCHANIWRYVLGVYRQTGTGHIWVAHSREEAAEYDAIDTTKHIDTGCVLPYDASGTNKEGYIQTMHFLKNLPLAPFCATVGGNSSNPVGDYCYHPAKTAGNTILLVGGYAHSGASDGRFCGYWINTSGNANWYIGGLPFLK